MLLEKGWNKLAQSPQTKVVCWLLSLYFFPVSHKSERLAHSTIICDDATIEIQLFGNMNHFL